MYVRTLAASIELGFIRGAPRPSRAVWKHLALDTPESQVARGRFCLPLCAMSTRLLVPSHPIPARYQHTLQAKTALDLDRVVGRITTIIQEAVLNRGQPPQMPIATPQLPPSTRPVRAYMLVWVSRVRMDRGSFVLYGSQAGFGAHGLLRAPFPSPLLASSRPDRAPLRRICYHFSPCRCTTRNKRFLWGLCRRMGLT